MPKQHGHQPLARIVGYGQAAVEPSWIFYAPVKAIPVALERAGWTMDDVDLFEVNEAFAAQVMADVKGLERDGYELTDGEAERQRRRDCARSSVGRDRARAC